MLGVLICVLSLAVLAADGATIDPRCSRYSQGMEAQVLPHLRDCRKFVICDMRGNGQVLSCPHGLYFDTDSHTCSFDTHSCTHGELMDGTGNAIEPQVPVQPQPLPVQPQPLPVEPELVQPIPVPVQPQPLPVQPELVEPIPIPVQPQPLPVQPQPLPVQPDLVQPIPVPVQPPNMNILPIVTAPTTVAPSTEQQVLDVETENLLNICWDQSAGKVYPVAHDCGQYVVCMGNGKAIVQRCPRGLLYDGKQQRCDFETSTSCVMPRVDDGSVVLDVHGVDMSLWEAEAPPVEESAPHPVEIEVQPQQQQQQQQQILMISEPEQAPEAEYNFRVFDNHPRCLARANPTLTAELPHDTDCSKYLVCVGRVAFEKRCPPGQHWNSRNNWCDFPSAARCKL